MEAESEGVHRPEKNGKDDFGEQVEDFEEFDGKRRIPVDEDVVSQGLLGLLMRDAGEVRVESLAEITESFGGDAEVPAAIRKPQKHSEDGAQGTAPQQDEPSIASDGGNKNCWWSDRTFGGSFQCKLLGQR